MKNIVEKPSGIISCHYSVNGIDKGTIKTGDILLLKVGQIHRFYLSEDFNIVDDTKDKLMAANEAKWAYILSYVLDKAKSTKENETYELWCNSYSQDENQPVKHFGIGKSYKKGSFIEFKPNDSDFWIGNSYHLKVFYNIPEKGLSFSFFPIGEPKISFAYFDEQKYTESEDKLNLNNGLHSYGQTIELHFCTHLIPAIFNDKFNVSTETNFKDLEVELFLTNMNGEILINQPIIRDSLSKFFRKTNGSNANCEYTIPILIDPDWRNSVHKKVEREKDYSIFIKIKNKISGREYTSYTRTEGITNINRTTKKLEKKKVSNFFLVKYETNDVILKNFEIQKNNLIQFIGDVKYTHKGFNPCGFSSISISDETEVSRPHLIIFDENLSENLDKTNKPFDIILGDNIKKKILVSLGNLQNQNVLCNSVLLSKGQKHNNSKNIFQLEKLIINNKSKIKTEAKFNKIQPKKNGNDNIDDNLVIDNIANIERWEEGRDYNYVGDNKLLLNLSYNYNKSIEISGDDVKYLNFLGAWLINYISLNKSKIQTYFIPISICRYPNQLAIIRLFPDIEWTINLFYNTTDPVWFGKQEPIYNIYGTETRATRDTISLKEINNKGNLIALTQLRREEENYNKNVNDGKKRISSSANNHFGDLKSNFGLSIKATYNAVESFEFSHHFSEKYRKMLLELKMVYDLADKITGAKDAREGAEKLSPTMMNRRSLMSLTLLPPAPSIGLSWKFAKNGDGVGLDIAGKVKCTPLIGGDLKIDLLALADKIPLYGKFITFLDLTTWLLEKISLDTLKITYRIDLIFYANLAMEEAYIKWNNANKKSGEIDTDMKFSGTFGGRLELELGLTLKAKQINKFPEIELQAGVKADCSFKITLSPNLNTNKTVDITTKFSGLVVSVYYKFSMKRNSKNKDNKTLEPFKLIDSFTGSPVSLKFGEGQEHKY